MIFTMIVGAGYGGSSISDTPSITLPINTSGKSFVFSWCKKWNPDNGSSVWCWNWCLLPFRRKLLSVETSALCCFGRSCPVLIAAPCVILAEAAQCWNQGRAPIRLKLPSVEIRPVHQLGSSCPVRKSYFMFYSLAHTFLQSDTYLFFSLINIGKTVP